MSQKGRLFILFAVGLVVTAVLVVAASTPKWSDSVLTVTTIVSVVVSGLSLYVAIDSWRGATNLVRASNTKISEAKEQIQDPALSLMIAKQMPGINAETSVAIAGTIIQTISPILDEAMSATPLWISTLKNPFVGYDAPHGSGPYDAKK